MDIRIRIAEEADFGQIVELFKEFAIFEKMPEKMVNSVERLICGKRIFNCYVSRD